ncbi:hypothetical protein GGQ68_004340 [Sagittula marina]|uniref:SMODS-associated and fused to various effectors domain-containing protein n=1 Tax=Sagittula marina TaxID=943940 RepID=A0A7W6DUG2_9RHOB|nr:hypothetical protein [Sagittula marina]MBB3987986.1 hypothetical protein [Sagittula marina]
MNWEERSAKACDLFIGVCGYESRSTFVYSEMVGGASSYLFLRFPSSGILSFDSNEALLSARSDVTFLDVASELWIAEVERHISDTLAADPDRTTIDVIFDVSSASRKIISQVLTLVKKKFSKRTSLTCVYAVAEFYDPPNSEIPSHISEPIVGDLAGWSDDLSKPPCAVVGLGFEPGRALGCLDYLEIPEARLFFPHGPDARFVAAVEKANGRLVAEIGSRFVLPYSVNSPNDTLIKLLSLITGLEADFRPIIIPFGPKIFATVAIVAAIQRSPNICVWRASSGGLGELHDSVAQGSVCCLTIEL